MQQNEKISPMKIQKLVYLAHGYSLAIRNAPLIDELFEAWRFGPVLPSLYHAIKNYGGNTITAYIKGDEHNILTPQNIEPITDDFTVAEIIRFVWGNYGRMDPLELSDWTHEKDGPWDTVISKRGFKFTNQQIDNDLIKDYFKRSMCENASQEA
jgi:uncharacterized phage-associated protein